ncbi:MAG: hypothetical protein WCE68_02210 [Anaerolineales bacterium]
MRNRQGCLASLLEFFLLDRVFNWLERRFGIGRGCSCSGCGCGLIVLVVAILLAISIITGTNWHSFF